MVAEPTADPAMEPVRVRPAEPGDLGAVAEIYAHYVRETVVTFELDPPDVDTWRSRFDHVTGRGLPFLVAELGSRVAGYAYCAPWKPRPAYRHTVEDSIYVAPGAARRGLGSRLLAGLLDGCAGAGVREVIAVIADAGQQGSVELHTRHGFRVAGRLVGVGFKHGRWVDTVLMQRRLG